MYRLSLKGHMRNMRIHKERQILDLLVTTYPLEAFEPYTVYMITH